MSKEKNYYLEIFCAFIIPRIPLINPYKVYTVKRTEIASNGYKYIKEATTIMITNILIATFLLKFIFLKLGYLKLLTIKNAKNKAPNKIKKLSPPLYFISSIIQLLRTTAAVGIGSPIKYLGSSSPVVTLNLASLIAPKTTKSPLTRAPNLP